MPQARKTQISLEATPYYHCMSRCVRRAFLCGIDPQTNVSYEHRRAWVEDRIIEQAEAFTIDVANYSVMSNHYHITLHINKIKADQLSFREVIERWHKLYKGDYRSQKFINGNLLEAAELIKLEETVEVWRGRLMDISWFMRRLNESISRRANKEDGCTGHFWQGRFKCQALLDEKALAACLAYVDLNPIRASIATTPETSDYTSIKKRINKAKTVTNPNHPKQQLRSLMVFSGNSSADMPEGLPFTLTDYLSLVDWTGRLIQADKSGSIPTKLPSILYRLNIEHSQWMNLTQQLEKNFRNFVGSPSALNKVQSLFKQKRRTSLAAAKTLLA